jgi:N-methylhydantoinase A
MVPVYDRARLRAGHRLDGPAVVEQYDATTVVCPEQRVEVDAIGNLVITTAG